MKNALALIACLLASCASFSNGARNSLVGEWRYADKIQSCHYSFKKDGSFKGEVSYQGRLVSRFSGRWGVKGDVLSYKYLSDALGRIPAGAIDHDKLLGVQRDSFLIEAADGSQRRYLRIRQG
jgi:hypothetical protein